MLGCCTRRRRAEAVDEDTIAVGNPPRGPGTRRDGFFERDGHEVASDSDEGVLLMTIAQTGAEKQAAAEKLRKKEEKSTEDQMKETDEFVQEVVAAKRTLSNDEKHAIRKKYTDPESIFSAMEGDDVQMMRCSWLRSLAPSAILPKRGERLVDSIIEAQEVRKQWNGRKPKRSYPWPDLRVECLPFIALSYFWRSPEHPDPYGVTLALIIKALNDLWKFYEAAKYTEMSMFIDWCSLYQAPRTPEQEKLFKQSLNSINLWYAHQQATLYSVTRGDVDGLTYWDKGWTTFEFKVANLIKPTNTTVHRVWPMLIDISADDYGIGPLDAQGRRDIKKAAGHWSLKHAPPSDPLAFRAGHAFSSKIFTNGADRDKIVARKFQNTTVEVLSSVELLVYNGADWGDDEIVELCSVLPLCMELHTLEMLGMKGGERGALALANVLRKSDVLPKLKSIRIHGGGCWCPWDVSDRVREELKAAGTAKSIYFTSG